MAANFHLMEIVNLYVGDHDPNKSLHLEIQTLKLPVLEEKFEDHPAGGAIGTIEIPVGMEKLSAGFSLLGGDPHVLAQFGLGSRNANIFTAYGVMRDAKGKRFDAKAVMEGRLGKVEPKDFERGKLHGHDFEIRGLTHYTLKYDGKDIYEYDWRTSVWKVNGKDEWKEMRRLARIP